MSATARLDQYLEQHESLQRKSLRSKKIAGPMPPPPPPPLLPQPPITMRELEEFEATVLKDHRYRMFRLKQIRTSMELSMSLMDSEDKALAQEACNRWGSGEDEDEVVTGDLDYGVGEISMRLNRTQSNITASLNSSRKERQSKAAMILAEFGQPGENSSKRGNPTDQDKDQSQGANMSRLEITAAYVDSLLGLAENKIS